MSKDALIVFAKNPELGKVKTRLAKSIGDHEALEVYKQLILHTQKQTVLNHAELVVYYSESIDTNDGWTAANRELQADGDLGMKMSQAFSNELAQYDKVCIIGTDCGELNYNHLNEAFDRLTDHDFVIGPANDGGYYLLGMKSFEPSLFEGVDWSTDQVLRQTIDKMTALEKSYFLLPELIDVDTREDWEKVKENFK